MKARYYNALLDLAVWVTNRASAFYSWAWDKAKHSVDREDG
jgi:hypothetical protein